MTDAVPSAGPRAAPGRSEFYQGQVLEWDALAGTNLVRIRGADCENVMSMLGPEVGLIRPGDSVIAMAVHNTFAVIGRIDLPGAEQRALGISFAETVTLNNTAAAGTWERRNGPAVSAYIGSTRRCMVTLSAEMSISSNVERVGVRVSGASSIAQVEWKALTFGGSGIEMQASRVLIFKADDGLNEGVNLFETMHKTSAASPLPLVGEVQITVQPF